MTRIAIVTDSTSDLSPQIRSRFNVTTVPLNVHFGDKSFRDQIDLTTDQFMARLQTTKDLPKTSQPSSGLFEETFRNLAKSHDGIVAVLISAKLSGTFQSATLAVESLGAKIPIEIVDSRNASLGLGFQVIRAAELAERGLGPVEIATELRAETSSYHLAFFVDTLEYLQRGGRIGMAAKLLGSILQLKPILGVEEGQIVPYERTRTRSKAIVGLEEFVRSFPQVNRLAVLYSSDDEDAEHLANQMSDIKTPEPLYRAQFSPVIGTHVGPGALGVCVYTGEGS
jgi:fatty acid kinase fatty acid binding subunit